MKKAFAVCLLASTLASTLASASVASADDDRARVHIKSEKHVQLEIRPLQHDAWMLACDSPCDLDLPLASEYRVVYGTEAGATRDYSGLIRLVSAVALIAGGGAVLTGVLLVNDAGPSASQKPVFAREPTWAGPRAAAPDKRAFVVPLSFSF